MGNLNLASNQDGVEIGDSVFQPRVRQQLVQRRKRVIHAGDLCGRLAGNLVFDKQDFLAALQCELIERAAEVLRFDTEMDGLGRIRVLDGIRRRGAGGSGDEQENRCAESRPGSDSRNQCLHPL